MTAPRLLAFGTLALIVSISASYGGPCTEEISNWQARIDAKAHAMAAAGPTGRQVGASTTIDLYRDQSALPRKNLVRCRLERLRLSDKPCCVRVPPIALVTKTRANKHSRKCNVQ